MTVDLVADAQQWNIDSILDRTKFMLGVQTGVYGYGIIDSRDPATAVAGGSRPLTVTPSSSDPSVTITGGTVFFGSGELVTIPTLANIGVPTTYSGERHVLYLLFAEEGHDPTLGDDDVLTYAWSGPPTDSLAYVRIARKTDYDLIPVSTRTLQIVPLAILTPSPTTVTVNMTRSEFAECRPWATPVDIQHRSYVGTGNVTDANPHGMAIADLSVVAGQTLYDFMLPHGVIISKDVGVAGVPGTLCAETIPALGVLTDISGAITGYAGAYYFRVSKFPTQVLKCVDAATKSIVFGVLQIPSKNILFFVPGDEWLPSMDVYIEYAATAAAAPPAATPSQTFPASNPGESETIVAGGVTVPSVLNGASFVNSGPYPYAATVYLGADGYLQTIPETLKCDIALSSVVGAQTLEMQPAFGTKLRVGLRGAIANPALDIRIDIIGTRASDGIQVTETISFGASYADSVIPATAENPAQWVTTTTEFSDVLSWNLTTRLNDGPNSAITIQAVYDPNIIDLSNSLPVARVFWNGLQLSDILDIRPLRVAATEVHTSNLEAAAVSFAETTLVRSTAPSKAVVGVWAEDFEYPAWVSSDSTVARWSNGLGAGDVYESRAIAVRPHVADAVSFRFAAVDPDQGFNGTIRFFTNTGWTPWLAMNTLTTPRYTYTFPAGQHLYKWQVRLQGPCKAFMATYLAATDAVPPTMVFDSGAFGIDSLG